MSKQDRLAVVTKQSRGRRPATSITSLISPAGGAPNVSFLLPPLSRSLSALQPFLYSLGFVLTANLTPPG